ncbi:MAG: AAA family ATPase [Candidatus Magasanikbacteria bacterium]|nr:AAA family ATPase [Candidatus Magasanikbacteria bacterium]
MKIAIIGTHSTGKTTIIQKLDERIKQLGFRTTILFELSRECPFPVNERTSYEAQAWIQAKHLEQENGVNHEDKIFICDRATLDNFAYFQNAVSDRDISEWEARAVEHMSTYDLVFKTRKLEINAKDDGFRTTDEDFRKAIDKKIKKLLKKHKIKHYLLPKTTNYNTHIRYILKRINDRLACQISDKQKYTLCQLKFPWIIKKYEK